jgi:hypothetical protein
MTGKPAAAASRRMNFVEHRERRPLRRAKRGNRIIDRADHRWLAMAGKLNEHRPVRRLKPRPNLVDHCERFADGASGFAQDNALTKRVISTGADKEMGGVGRQLFELCRDILGHVPIDGEQRRTPTGRQRLTHLVNHGRPVGHITRVVENRITEQNDV